MKYMVYVLCRFVKLGVFILGDNFMIMNDVILIDDEEDEISQDQKFDSIKLEKMVFNDFLDLDFFSDLDVDLFIQLKSIIVKVVLVIFGMLNNFLKIVVFFMNFI